MPIMVMNSSAPNTTCTNAVYNPPVKIQIILNNRDRQPPLLSELTTFLPKGHKTRPAILKHCIPNGIPIMVTHNTNPPKTSPMQAARQAKTKIGGAHPDPISERRHTLATASRVRWTLRGRSGRTGQHVVGHDRRATCGPPTRPTERRGSRSTWQPARATPGHRPARCPSASTGPGGPRWNPCP